MGKKKIKLMIRNADMMSLVDSLTRMLQSCLSSYYCSTFRDNLQSESRGLCLADMGLSDLSDMMAPDHLKLFML